MVYPEAVWYTYLDETDIDEILSEHLFNVTIVEYAVSPPVTLDARDHAGFLPVLQRSFRYIETIIERDILRIFSTDTRMKISSS